MSIILDYNTKDKKSHYFFYRFFTSFLFYILKEELLNYTKDGPGGLNNSIDDLKMHRDIKMRLKVKKTNKLWEYEKIKNEPIKYRTHKK